MSSTDVALPSTNGRHADMTQATAIASARAVAEVEAMVIVAQRCPRDMNRARAEIKAECGRMAMATKAFYSVPNRGKGTTVHLAREMARIVGNIEYGVHELRRDDIAGMSEIQAYAWDLQTNTRSTRTFQVPHQKMVGKTRTNLVDLGDVYLNNQNIGARAVRECINTVLPTSLVEDAADWCRNTLEHGEGKPIEERRDAMVAVFARIGVTVEQLEARLGRKRSQWEPGDLADASVLFKSIERGEMAKDEAFPPITISEADLPPAPTPPAPTPAAPPAEAPTPTPEPVTSDVAALAASSAEEITPPSSARTTPTNNVGKPSPYGDVVDGDPTPAQGTSRTDSETPIQIITRLAKAHGVEGTDALLDMFVTITGVEHVKLSEYRNPEVLKVKRFLEDMGDDEQFEFAEVADAKADATSPPAPQPPDDVESWDDARWRAFIALHGLKVAEIGPGLKEIAEANQVRVPMLEDVAGKGVAGDVWALVVARSKKTKP